MKSSAFSQIVAKERKQLGYTQEEFALRVGVSLSFLRNLEQGSTNLQLSKVIEVLDFLGFDLRAKRRGKL